MAKDDKKLIKKNDQELKDTVDLVVKYLTQNNELDSLTDIQLNGMASLKGTDAKIYSALTDSITEIEAEMGSFDYMKNEHLDRIVKNIFALNIDNASIIKGALYGEASKSPVPKVTVLATKLGAKVKKAGKSGCSAAINPVVDTDEVVVETTEEVILNKDIIVKYIAYLQAVVSMEALISEVNNLDNKAILDKMSMFQDVITSRSSDDVYNAEISKLIGYEGDTSELEVLIKDNTTLNIPAVDIVKTIVEFKGDVKDMSKGLNKLFKLDKNANTVPVAPAAPAVVENKVEDVKISVYDYLMDGSNEEEIIKAIKAGDKDALCDFDKIEDIQENMGDILGCSTVEELRQLSDEKKVEFINNTYVVLYGIFERIIKLSEAVGEELETDALSSEILKGLTDMFGSDIAEILFDKGEVKLSDITGSKIPTLRTSNTIVEKDEKLVEYNGVKLTASVQYSRKEFNALPSYLRKSVDRLCNVTHGFTLSSLPYFN